MNMQAVIQNEKQPERGTVTISLPIPMMEYDEVLDQLETLGIGGVLERDCNVVELNSRSFPILKRLENSRVNLDELDYLAKRLDSLWPPEDAQFQGAAVARGISGIQDFINLTFCCQEVTVVQDFNDLDSIGRQYYMTRMGGAISTEEWRTRDFRKDALDLLLNVDGEVTPYGVVYENGMKLEQLYDGGQFPEYLYDSIMCVEAETKTGQEFGVLLPMTDRRLQRELVRAGADHPADVSIRQVDWYLEREMECCFDLQQENMFSLNLLCRTVNFLCPEELEKLAEINSIVRPTRSEVLERLAVHLRAMENHMEEHSDLQIGGMK